jgi:WD40 repeat protein
LRSGIVAATILLLVATGIAIWLARAHPQIVPRVDAMAFSPDGRLLAAGDRQGSIAIWRLDSLTPAKRVHIKDVGLNALAFSPDSRLLAVAGRSLQLWSTADWKKVANLGAAGGVYGTARFSSDGRALASVNASERIEIWATQTGKRIRTLCCMAEGVPVVVEG